MAYIGDDIDDVELLKHVGLAACPIDAEEGVLNTAGINILPCAGGRGVLRKLANSILK